MDETTPLLKKSERVVIFEKSDINRNPHILENKPKPSSSTSSTHDVSLNKENYQTYWYRWYICLLFSFLGGLQGSICNTWGPIDESAEIAFGFTSTEIALLASWQAIVFTLFMPVFMVWMDRKGLRIPTVATASLMVAGTGLRCFPFGIPLRRYLIHFGQILNGLAGCVIMAAPTFISSLWFPSRERILATSVITMLTNLGTACSYTFGFIVENPTNSTKNLSCIDLDFSNNSQHCETLDIIREEIDNILYVEFGLSMMVLISVFLFFPNRPPNPPSVSASLPRRNLRLGLQELRHKNSFWIISIALTLVVGAWGSWCGMMSIMLKPMNISQSESGLLGLIMVLVGSISGIFFGWFTDRLKGRMKLILVILNTTSLLLFIYFVIIANQWIKVVPFLPQRAEIWTIFVILGISIFASTPVGMEMVADAGFPVSEGTSTSIVVWFFNIISSVYLLIVLFTDPLTSNNIYLGFLLLSYPLVVFFTDKKNHRLEIDLSVADKI